MLLLTLHSTNRFEYTIHTLTWKPQRRYDGKCKKDNHALVGENSFFLVWHPFYLGIVWWVYVDKSNSTQSLSTHDLFEAVVYLYDDDENDDDDKGCLKR